MPMVLPVLYRDDDLLVVHKPAGLLVHRTSLDAQEDRNALDVLRAQLGPGAPDALAPAHRLDKGTSGVLVFSCHAQASRSLREAFDDGRCRKDYLALVRGWPAPAFVIDHPLARDPERPSAGQLHRQAHTDVRTLAQASWPVVTRAGWPTTRVALVLAQPHQGRRHQIRRHLKHAAHPIIGDATHGKGPLNRALADWLGLSRLWLHALRLSLPHPRDGRLLTLQAPPDAFWSTMLSRPGWQPPLTPALQGLLQAGTMPL